MDEKTIKFNPYLIEKEGKHVRALTIVLPGIRAISRNQTSGHYFKYREQLKRAERWMLTYGKAVEYHFEKQVDVTIEAYYNTKGRRKLTDTPNIDDKIFTDILNRFKPRKKGPAAERAVWFIEDDAPKFLRKVTKRSVPCTYDEVRIFIEAVS